MYIVIMVFQIKVIKKLLCIGNELRYSPLVGPQAHFHICNVVKTVESPQWLSREFPRVIRESDDPRELSKVNFSDNHRGISTVFQTFELKQ